MKNRIEDAFREAMERPDPVPVKGFGKFVTASGLTVMMGSDGPGKPANCVLLKIDVPGLPHPVAFSSNEPQQLRGIIADLQDALSRLEAPR